MQILTKIFLQTFAVSKIISIFAPRLRNDANMVTVVQLVRASDCGSECRGFESLQSPKRKRNFSNDFPLFFAIYQAFGRINPKICRKEPHYK